ncbi:hypothetical protein PR003_g1263 [Phytophthora rubi]|uniref:RxLR effector PexRD54 WY domain-containing protein n=1 Tax=Phytophthora rubi TaxID=129364 RepID=A0A6A3NAM6_9STRA|nr:hypothetical protein PR002_g3894 [Phytophthora rubi]KAE9358461.1 hypothetical protein PR003_g1263 [Phytophthora rubi]
MRVCGVVLFAVTALFAGSDADLSVKGKKTVASAILATGTVDLLPFAGNGAPANRFLREDEERVGGSVSIVDKFKGLKSTLQLRANKGKPASEVFSSLGLAKAGDELFDKTKFADWVKYVDAFNAKNPTKTTSTIPTLIARYGDDGLFQLIEAAKKASSTNSLAVRLQGEQMQYWATIGKSPDEVFGLFSLARAGDGIFSNPEGLTTWAKYVDDFNAKNQNKATSTISTLIKYYNDDALAKMIELAKNAQTTKSIATKLNAAQMNGWLNSGKSADDVFTLLKLDKSADDLFKNPLYTTWTTYMQIFNQQNPGKNTDLFTTLEKHYKSKPLLKILEEAKKYPSLEAAATKLQADKIQSYLGRKISPDEVFYQLSLEQSSNVFTNSLFNTWLKYLNTFNKQNLKKQEFWYRTLERHVKYFQLERMIDEAMRNPGTEKIARLALDKWLKVWLRKENPPKNVFKELYLQRAGDGLIASQNFPFWTKYVSDFNRRYPTEKTTILDTLLSYYKDSSLFQILEKAKKVSSSEKTATTLQLSLLNRWVREKKTPEDVATLLMVEVSEPLMKTYVHKFTRKWGNSA